MSQITKHYGSGNYVESLKPEDLSLVTPVDNKIYVIGGTNINTEADTYTVQANLDEAIVVDSAQIGNINIENNIISSTDTDGDINLDPDGNGKVVLNYSDPYSAVLTNADSKLETSQMGDGQTIIGYSNSTPVVSTLTAGTDISITNGPNSITIATSGESQGGLLGWDYYYYNGSQEQRFSVESNRGSITNSIISTASGPSLCPKKNFIFKLPVSNDLTVGDSFFFVNKGSGSFVVNGYSDQTFIGTGRNRSLPTRPSESRASDFSKSWIKPTDENIYGILYPYIDFQYRYLSSIVLLYVGEVNYVSNSAGQTGQVFKYPHTFVSLQMAGLFTVTSTNQVQSVQCYTF